MHLVIKGCDNLLISIPISIFNVVAEKSKTKLI